MKAINFLFSFTGRISRQTFWMAALGGIVFFVAAGVAMNALAGPDGKSAFDNVFVALMLPLVWISLAIQVKRWHDRGRSGWRVLINFIPVIGAIWALIELGILPGTQGKNEYGPDPLGAAVPAVA